jgi:hypothetical protein
MAGWLINQELLKQSGGTMTTALITGGAGFIGSHLAEALLRLGWKVEVIDDLTTGGIDNIAHLKGNPHFSYVLDTVMNRSLLMELVDRADIIFHLAAAVGVRLIVEQPVRTIETNIKATELILELGARKRKPVLLISTSEVLRKVGACKVQRGRRFDIGIDFAVPMVLCSFQNYRRVSRQSLLQGKGNTYCRPTPFQHDRPAPDRSIRNGCAALCAPGPLRRSYHGLRRRQAAALVYMGRRRCRCYVN